MNDITDSMYESKIKGNNLLVEFDFHVRKFNFSKQENNFPP